MAAGEGDSDGGVSAVQVSEDQEVEVVEGHQEFADDAAVAAVADGPNPDPLPSDNYKEDLTMTDHLNKSLLQSFLNRINMPGSDVPVSEPIDEPEEEEEATTEEGEQAASS